MHKRIPVRLKFESADEFIAQYAAQPQLRGVHVPTNVDVPKGTQLDLTLDFGGGKGIRAVGEVLSSNPGSGSAKFSVAVRFIAMDPAHHKWLEEKAAAIREKSDSPREHQLRKAQSAKSLDDAGLDVAKVAFTAEDGEVMGIDLGTCNSCVCVFVGGKPVIVDLGEGELPAGSPARTLPSVVSYNDEGATLVGEPAAADIINNARRTVFGAKRFIGRPYDSPHVQDMLSRFPYKVVPGREGQVAIEVNTRSVSLTAVSARVLEAIQKRVVERTGRTITKAVITVPAYYNENQRNAVMQAGKIAGLEVKRVLNEPTAAAIAYGLLKSRPRRLLVYDLGGGTFDVSVMSVHRDSLQVLATAGDTFLGGEDFDAAIVEIVLEKYNAKNKKKPLSQNASALARIKDAAEKAKRRLSFKDEAMVTVREAILTGGESTRLEIPITRKEYEDRVRPLIERSLKICDMAIREARLSASDLGDVLLVGGQTRSPQVFEMVRDHFQITPRCDINPDHVVAMGAGMLAHLPQSESGRVQDVLSMSIGVAAGQQFKPIILRNTPLPHAKRIRITVPAAQWQSYKLEVWQGESAQLHQNEHLGDIVVDALSAGSEDPVPVMIDFAITPDGMLKVRVVNAATEESRGIVLRTRDS